MSEQGPGGPEVRGPTGAPGDSATVYGRVTRFGAPPHVSPGPPPAPPWPPPSATGPFPGSWPAPDAIPAGGRNHGPVATDGAWASGPVAQPWPPPSWAPPAAPPSWQPEAYASWGRRMLATLVDDVPAIVASAVLVAAYLPLYVGVFRGDLSARPDRVLLVAGLALSLAALGWRAYNRWFLAGRTGQSVGKRATRTWLVSARDGRPVGALDAFLRDLVHTLDAMASVGYLWPLWDARRQTFADMILATVVVRTPVAPSPTRRGPPAPEPLPHAPAGRQGWTTTGADTLGPGW